MPFQFEAPPRSPSLADLIMAPALARAQAIDRIGQVQANAALQSGQAWGQAIGNIGQAGAQIAGQLAYQSSPEAKLQQAKWDDVQTARKGQAVLTQAIKQFTTLNEDTGKIEPDHQAIATAVSQAGYPQLAQSWLKSAADNAENLDKLQTTRLAHQRQQVQTIGDLAFRSQSAIDFTANVGLAATYGLLEEKQAHGVLAEAESAGPDGWKAIRDKYQVFSPTYQKQQEELNKPVKLGPGDVLGVPATKETLLTGGAEKPTEASLAMAAAGGDAKAKDALGLLKQQQGSEWSMFAGAYTKGLGKTTWEELDPKSQLAAFKAFATVKADPAADRQAIAIAAQVAAQNRQQTFTEQQTGRKELTDKVEAPYQTSVSSANTLRETVKAAQAGNKVAGSLQALETTFAAVRAQNLNRVNMAEIGLPASAGNVWDRIQGWWGKKTEGQPIPADIQKDMLQFADILEKAAYQKYMTQYQAVTKRYGLTDEKPLSAPGSVTPPDTAKTSSPGLDALRKRKP